MKCIQCGYESKEADSKFCSNCGKGYFVKKIKSPTKWSVFGWSIIGAWSGSLFFTFLYYSTPENFKDYDLLVLSVWFISIGYGIYYFVSNNKKVKRMDSRYPDKRQSFGKKLSWALLGFLGAAFAAWVGIIILVDGYDTKLEIMDFSLMALAGYWGSSALWEFKVLKDYD